ncbi:fibronectin type III domain-containing protein [Flavivirga spongiicola]|uniref:Fibronectin type III domain-containing protein n=1 Tax=Flavivirga spongiicola TaxID=421621 RepID=A0ABU7XLZ6_9FLAO|nr:fibronectin type III domain-containing protein [Flavivirga sp. MEBiC05379]MDO5981446.1 fibronectin type III domain-containing protein [Flavivirga sp. MEBiC05379]
MMITFKKIILLSFLMITGNMIAQSFQDWNRKQAITINSNQIGGATNLTDFPFLVTLDHLNGEIVDGGSNSALNGGGDLRFSSDAAGSNRLAIEVVEFITDATSSNRKCQVWVKIPSLSATADTTIYVWYNKTGETQPAATDTYGSQAVWTNYNFVSHDCITDSSGNKVINQTVAADTADSVFDGTTANFNGTDDRHTIDISDWNLAAGQTITFWANYDNTSSYQRMINLINSTGVVQIMKGDQSLPEDIIFFSSTNIATDGVNGDSRKADLAAQNQWVYIRASTIDLNSGRNYKVNNIDHSTVLPSVHNWTPSTNDNVMTIGARGDNTNHFQGKIASLMISPLQLSDDYAASTYNNQNTPATFATAGAPQAASPSDNQAPTASTLSSSAQTDTTVDLSWTAATDNIAVTGYKVYKDAVLETTLGNVLTYQVTGLTASTAYNFTVTALDAAGNESVVSNTLNITTNNASSFDPDYQAILDEATTQGYTLPSSSDQIIQNAKVVSAKASGVWNLADYILVFTETSSKEFKMINWKNPTQKAIPYQGSSVVSDLVPLLDSSTGLSSNGTRYLSLYNPSQGGVNYTLNNAGIYVNVVTAPSNYFVTAANLGTTNGSLRILQENVSSDQILNGSSVIQDMSGTGLKGISRNSSTNIIFSNDTTTNTVSNGSTSINNNSLSLWGAQWATDESWNRGDAKIGYVIIGADMSANLTDIKTAFDVTSNNDTQSPTAPTLSSTSQTNTTVDLSWTAATDNIAVTGYKVYKDAVLETTLGNVLTYQVTGLTAATAYNFTVTALDAAGNESVVSNTESITTNAVSGGGSGNWTLNNQDVYYNTGNVGIGTNTPDEKLAVNGNIHAKEIRVDLNDWPDYVFTKDHDLLTLKQVKNYIKSKGHLPNIPSAKEVEENGVKLGEMNVKLLEKIEELTLYILHLKNTLDLQKEQIKNLERN